MLQNGRLLNRMGLFVIVFTLLFHSIGLAQEQPWAAFQQHLEVIQRQLNELRAKNIANAYYHFSSKEFRYMTSFDDFYRFTEAYPILTEHQRAAFDDMFFIDQVAVFQGNLYGRDGRVFGIEYKLIDERGFWKVFAIKVSNQKKM